MTDTARRATELAVQHNDCPACIAEKGELCYAQTASGSIIRHIAHTHLARFGGLGSPEAYIEKMTYKSS